MYQIVDANNEPITETLFKSGREASEAKRVYLDHCDDLALPLKVVPAGERMSISCSICGKPTTRDSTYGTLCYRCIRAKND